MNKELSRHEIREMALQALFPLDFNADLTKRRCDFQRNRIRPPRHDQRR